MEQAAEPRIVILVPRRDGFVDRDANWAWVRRWWLAEFPEAELFEGLHQEGLFNRACAVNRAAGLADWQQPRPWDIALIIDADVICDPPRVRAGIAEAVKTGRMVLPFDVRHDLDENGTRQVTRGFKGSWRGYIRRTWPNMVSSVNIVTRGLWDAVGGFDEGFIGWGFEDNAFTAACRTFSGGDEIRLPGELWHLYHKTAPEGKKGTETFVRNQRRADLYLLAKGDVEATRALRHTAPPAYEHRPTGIPRILHRTVPAQTSPEVEQFWKDWARLHPDWELMTHRDPLPAAAWPETGHKWAACSNGAQRAGLIRLEALWRWGGVYVDQDVQPVRSLEPLLPLGAFAAWEDPKCVPDAVIAAVPGHPAIRECLALALARVPGDTWQSGPGVTTTVFPKYSSVLLLPPGSFYPVHYRDPERDAKMRAPVTDPWVFGLHHYHGSWLAKKAAVA